MIKDRSLAQLAATNARKLQRMADATDGDVAQAAGWDRDRYRKLINRAIKGEGDLTLDQARVIAEQVYGLPLFVILIEDPKEFMQWLANNRPEVEIVVDLTGEQHNRGSWCSPRSRLLDYLAHNFGGPLSSSTQGLALS